MNALHDWAVAWRIPPAALADLQARMGVLADHALPVLPGRSEAAVQNRVRLAAAARGWRLWRNNVGAYEDQSGAWVRYGLCNDSPALNARVKSADLIGIAPRVIQPGDVGSLIGQFVIVEVKHEGWKWTGSGREQAQAAWAALVQSAGGLSTFSTGEIAL